MTRLNTELESECVQRRVVASTRPPPGSVRDEKWKKNIHLSRQPAPTPRALNTAT